MLSDNALCAQIQGRDANRPKTCAEPAARMILSSGFLGAVVIFGFLCQFSGISIRFCAQSCRVLGLGYVRCSGGFSGQGSMLIGSRVAMLHGYVWKARRLQRLQFESDQRRGLY